MALDDDVAEAGGCMVVEDEEDAFPILLSALPSAPPPPAPPLRASVKSWESMAGLSIVELVGVCTLLLPLGIPTKWLWLEWLVNRSFISS